MSSRALKGGLSFEGRKPRPLFASAAPAPFETIEQQRFFSWLKESERVQTDADTREALSWIHSIPNGAHVKKGHAARLVAEGLTAGILDIACDEPRGDYHGLRIEMKRKGGRLRLEQASYMKYLERIGIRVGLCFSWQDAARLVVEYFRLDRHAPIYG